MKYVPRWLESRLIEALKAHPVVILTGPRQVGKSTLLKYAHFLKDWKYITLDDPDALMQAKEDPKGLLLDNKPTIIDEIQRHPDLLLAVKYFVDESGRKRSFILSGSGNISLRKTPRETLAGRVVYLHLTGFSYRELQGSSSKGILAEVFNGREIKESNAKIPLNLAQVVWRGCLPGIVLAQNDKLALERLNSYIDTYIQRDIQDLIKIRHPQNFRRLMEALSEATGWESVQEELSNKCSETRTNVSRYLSLLKETNLLYDLKGYSIGGERAYRQSKYYWFDSGTACFLSGLHSAKDLAKPDIKGRYFENYILQQLLSWVSLQVVMPELNYWRLKDSQEEVDFIISIAGKTIGLEVKSSKQLTFRDTKPMREFIKTHPKVLKGIIVYSGDRVYPVASNIYAVPWTML